jgi:hypothetical protein
MIFPRPDTYCLLAPKSKAAGLSAGSPRKPGGFSCYNFALTSE